MKARRVWLVVFCGISLARGEPPSQEMLEASLAALDQTMNPAPAEYYIKIVNEVPGKDPEESILYAVNKGNKWAGIITVPEAYKGRSALRLEHEIWYRLPGELLPRRRQLHQSLVPGTLEYSMMFRIADAPHYRPQLVSSEEGRLALQLFPRTGSNGLANRYLVIDTRLNIPQTETQFSSTGMALKEISYQEVRQFGSLPPRPAKVVVKSLVNNGYATTMTLGWVQTREIPDQAFTPEFLPRVGTLLQE